MPSKLIFLILLFIALTLPAAAQVGVNKPNPEQALDVNGKIKIADDGAVPSEGTIRYNNSEESFEGYTDGEWQSFNKAGVPEDVEYLQLYDPNLTVTGQWEAIPQQADNTNGFARNWSTVPVGKKLIVDFIQFIPRSDNEDLYFRVAVAPSPNPVTGNGSSLRNPRLYLSGNSNTGNAVLQASRAPLSVVHAGQTIAIYNSLASQTSMRCVITGFLVDENATDDFFTY